MTPPPLKLKNFNFLVFFFNEGFPKGNKSGDKKTTPEKSEKKSTPSKEEKKATPNKDEKKRKNSSDPKSAEKKAKN